MRDLTSQKCCQLFGSANNLGQNENDTVVLNCEGYNTIAMRVIAATGGVAAFEATFDGTNWEAITLRSIKDDIFEQTTNNDSDFIGSIAGARQIRIRTSSAGSAPGTVMGTMMKEVSTLEGIEFGYPPHRFGFPPIHKDASFTTAQTGTSIWTPASGKKFVLTDLIMTFAGVNNGTVTIFDETNSSGNLIYKGSIDITKDTNLPVVVPLSTPFVSSAVDNDIKITTSADITVDIIMHGYEI